jgi:nickel-type superoxide dismutase maturation protease
MLRLFKVTGKSLQPNYYEGDFVLVSKIPFWVRRPRPGDIVVFRHPRFGMMIKRVERVTPKQDLFVSGTHATSNDSDNFGVIPFTSVIGKVVAGFKKGNRI